MKKSVLMMYPLTFLIFTIFSYFFIDVNYFPLQSLYTGFYSNHRGMVALLYTLLISLLFAEYMLILFLLKHKILVFSQIRLLVILIFIATILSYPAMLSFDIFNYMATAKTLFFYRENPYIVMPIDFIGESLLMYTRAANKIALYGPVWIISSGIPYFLSFGNVLLSVLNFKAFVAIFYFGTLWLIWQLSKKNIYSLAFFSLNPLILIEIFVSGHNDIVMIFFVLSSFYTLSRQKYFLAIIIFITSILIKYATIFLLPVFIYTLYRKYRNGDYKFERTYLLCAIVMLVVFLLSFLREEIYPWYALWFLSFISLILDKKQAVTLSIIFSFSLLLRYVPFMFYGTYGGSTPLLRELLTFIPMGIALLIPPLLKKKHD